MSFHTFKTPCSFAYIAPFASTWWHLTNHMIATIAFFRWCIAKWTMLRNIFSIGVSDIRNLDSFSFRLKHISPMWDPPSYRWGKVMISYHLVFRLFHILISWDVRPFYIWYKNSIYLNIFVLTNFHAVKLHINGDGVDQL